MSGDRGWRAYLPDVAVPAGVAGLLLLHVLFGPGRALDHAPGDYLLLLVGALALVAARRYPVVALLVTTLAMMAYAARVHPGPPAGFPVLAAVYLAARGGHRLLAVAASAGYLAAILAMSLATPTGELGWFVAANVAGAVSRQRQAYLAQVEQRVLEAEHTREETALRRAGEERLRIARELHDSLTHSISIIKLQAGVAVHLARKRGEEVPEALLAIQEASGEAMRELRATLEVLRGGDGNGNGLDRIADLAERARSAGLTTTLAVNGSPRTVPVEVGQAAYRIVQEALTNVTRHAGRASASVRIDYLPQQLAIRVDDDGTAAPATPPPDGNGLTGMRERVAALGGTLRAGPRPEGGFAVYAELPSAETP